MDNKIQYQAVVVCFNGKSKVTGWYDLRFKAHKAGMALAAKMEDVRYMDIYDNDGDIT